MGPAHVAVAGGGVYSGQTPLAERLDESTLDVTLERFDPRTTAGADVLHRLSVSAAAQAVVPELARLSLPLPAGLTIRGPVELRSAVFHVTHGALDGDGHLEAAAPNAVAIAGDHRVTGSLQITADVAAAHANRRESLAVRVVMRELALSRAEGSRTGSPFLRAPELVATGESSALDLASPLGDLHVVVEMPDAEVGRARELSRYAPADTAVAIAGGRARASVHFEAWLADKRAAGRGTLRAEDLDVRLAKVHVRGRISVHAEFASYRFDTRRLEGASLSMDVAQGGLASTAAPDEPLVHLSGARLDGHASVVELRDPLRALDVAISMPDADVVSRGLLRAYLPKGADVQTASGHSRFSLEGHLVIGDHLARGFLDLQSRELRLAYRALRLDARVHARARVHDWRWETGDSALDEASIDVDRFAVTSRASEGRGAPPAMSVARIAVKARSPRFEFDRPMANVSLSADLADASVRDSSAVNAFLPQNATFALDADGGHFDARLDVDVEDRVARGVVRARATSMGAASGALRLRGDVGLAADFVDWDLDKDTLTLLDSRLDMTRVTGWLSARGPPQLSAERVELGVRSPKIDVARPSLEGADFHLVIQRAELPDARSLAAQFPADGTFGIESGAAQVAADVDVSHSRRTATGGVDVAVARGAIRLDETHLSGSFRFRVRISGFDPEGERLDVAGTRLEMRDVTVTGASAATSGWRGNVDSGSRVAAFDGRAGVRRSRPSRRHRCQASSGHPLRELPAEVRRPPHRHAALDCVGEGRGLGPSTRDARSRRAGRQRRPARQLRRPRGAPSRRDHRQKGVHLHRAAPRRQRLGAAPLRIAEVAEGPDPRRQDASRGARAAVASVRASTCAAPRGDRPRCAGAGRRRATDGANGSAQTFRAKVPGGCLYQPGSS